MSSNFIKVTVYCDICGKTDEYFFDIEKCEDIKNNFIKHNWIFQGGETICLDCMNILKQEEDNG